MAVSEARGLSPCDIRCPQCKKVRTVDPRQARRFREGHIAGTCSVCRGRGATRKATDKAMRYWLTEFGAPVPRHMKARDYLAASGMPSELAQFARECFPP